jgi:hypothetical protein
VYASQGVKLLKRVLAYCCGVEYLLFPRIDPVYYCFSGPSVDKKKEQSRRESPLFRVQC